jgi:glycyl-tRNA synthetase beta chain
LRRAAQGIVRTLVEGKIGIPPFELLGDDDQLRTFFEDRVRFYFRDHCGFRYDEVNACLVGRWTNLLILESNLKRIQSLRSTPDFEPIAASFKRIRNILEQAKFTGGATVDEALLEAGPERDLYLEYRRIQGQPIEDAIAVLRPKIDLFFDKVLVNAPKEDLRQNRLALLNGLRLEFLNVADFSEIVTSS